MSPCSTSVILHISPSFALNRALYLVSKGHDEFKGGSRENEEDGGGPWHCPCIQQKVGHLILIILLPSIFYQLLIISPISPSDVAVVPVGRHDEEYGVSREDLFISVNFTSMIATNN